MVDGEQIILFLWPWGNAVGYLAQCVVAAVVWRNCGICGLFLDVSDSVWILLYDIMDSEYFCLMDLYIPRDLNN